MKVCALYRQNSEHARKIEEFLHEFSRLYPDRKIEVIDLDTRDGAATASLYDIVRYPAVLALTDDGQLTRSWEGDQLPLISEVASYASPELHAAFL